MYQLTHEHLQYVQHLELQANEQTMQHCNTNVTHTQQGQNFDGLARKVDV
jgi:hypothetical protein